MIKVKIRKVARGGGRGGVTRYSKAFSRKDP